MDITEVMRRNVVTCRPDETLDVAAGRMWNESIGSLPVINDEGHVVGMITDRDLGMAAFAEGKPLQAIAVRSAMTKRVYTCFATDPITTAEAVMRRHHVRRLPVIDTHDHLVGIVSLADMAIAVMRTGRTDRDAEIVATLAAVGGPRPVVASPGG